MTSRKWYTLAGFCARIFAGIERSGVDPQIQALSAACYGLVDLFGVKKSVQLVLKLRRKVNSGRTKKGQQTQNPLPRV